MVTDNDNVSRRKHPRYRVHFPAIIVYGNHGDNELFHGRTHDISIGGASIYSEKNIFVEGAITLFLKLPPHVENRTEIIIEIQSRMTNIILSSDHQHFRIGMQFLHFKENGRELLESNLSHRSPLLT